MLYGNFEARVKMPCLLGESGGDPEYLCHLQSQVRPGEMGGHRPQLWKECSAVAGLPAGPRGPQLQHLRERKGARGERWQRLGSIDSMCAGPSAHPDPPRLCSPV